VSGPQAVVQVGGPQMGGAKEGFWLRVEVCGFQGLEVLALCFAQPLVYFACWVPAVVVVLTLVIPAAGRILSRNKPDW
jgi:hypothetical protein